jgi:hypothetical protein
MKRRTFLQMLGAAALIHKLPVGASTSTTSEDGIYPSDVVHREEGYLEPDIGVVSSNWANWQETLKRILESGDQVVRYELRAERDGYRQAFVEIIREGHPVTEKFYVPWTKESHIRGNVHYDLHTCVCGVTSFQQHHWECQRATHLAWKLKGDFSKYK